VLILEAMAQLSAFLAAPAGAKESNEAVSRRRPALLAVERAKFRKPVVPGDRLDLQVTVLRQRGTALRVAAEAHVDQLLVAEAELLVAMT
jgi:3-hydroxyacyl-[acyl-carrier-protein] dehydratase